MMSKFGDDLIQSLKEALAHARGDGPGSEHVRESLRGPGAGNAQAKADDAD